MAKFWRSLGGDLGEVWPQVGVAVVLFVGAGILGAIDTRAGSAALAAFQEVARGLMAKPVGGLILSIFLRNGTAALIAIAGGVFFGLVPLAAILFNGALCGTVLRLFPGEIWKVLPHGLFELPAMFIAWGLGLWIGLALLERLPLRYLGERLRRGLRLYLRLILPLLAVAAVIEGIFAHLLRG